MTDTSRPKTSATKLPPTTPSTPATPRAVAGPPAVASLPVPPVGFQATNGARFRGFVPTAGEMQYVPDAVKQLAALAEARRADDLLAPALHDLLLALTRASQWTTSRNVLAHWDAYARDQEGYAWVHTRDAMKRFNKLFAVITETNPALAQRCSTLAAFLNEKKAIAATATSTKKLNKEAVLEGRSPVHGASGKRRQAAAGKALLAAKNKGSSG